MKKMLFLIIVLPIISTAQIEVTPKPKTLVTTGPEFRPCSLKKYLYKKEIVYLVQYTDDRYKSIIDLKSFDFTKDQLKEFASAIVIAQKSQAGQMIKGPKYFITKRNDGDGLWIFSREDESIFALKMSDIKKWLDAIGKI